MSNDKAFKVKNGLELAGYDTSKAVTAVDVFVYDTSKDSDGGAWRKRTQHTSWYNETLNTATRGARREFPAVAVIVAEAANVTIYDGDDPSLPMWMVVSGGSDRFFNTAGSGAVTAVSMRNGWLVGTSSTRGYSRLNFISEEAYIGLGTVTYKVTAPIAVFRNATVFPTYTVAGSLFAIVNQAANDLAMTVLPDAPIDPATGLPVPTIAVATAGGVSVIKDNETVVDSSYTGVWGSCSLEQNALVAASQTTGGVYFFGNVGDILADGFSGQIYSRATIPAMAEYFFSSGEGVFAGGALSGATAGITHLDENPATPSKGMVAYTTSTYNTGWMNGDIKGAFLSDTDDTDLVGSGELVTNGTFDTDTTGWSVNPANDETISVVSGRLRVTYGADGSAGGGGAFQTLSGLTVGKVYKVSIGERLVGTNGAVGVGVFTTLVGTGQIATVYGFSNATNEQYDFVATAPTLYLRVYGGYGTSGSYVEADNISVKLADADRSVNNKGLIVNGTVTRSPVATGADLVAYSGFSASNYLEQPYNSGLDFGTGDFSVMGWVKLTANATSNILQQVTSAWSSSSPAWSQARWSLYYYSPGSEFAFQYGTAAGSGAFVSAPGLGIGQWVHVVLVYSGGVASLYLNGILADEAALSLTTANTYYKTVAGGYAPGAASNAGSQSLLRISATAPTAEQIAKIYNDEKVLFQENAQATLYGASDAVTALAHDPVTDLLHVGTSAGRSVFSGLRRVSNTTTAVGTAISASNGLVAEE